MNQQNEPVNQQELHPSVSHVLKYFRYEHLPLDLQGVSKPFGELANGVALRNPDSPETTVALRKLLEAKDAAVRAALDS
jgi:hypothetical protein